MTEVPPEKLQHTNSEPSLTTTDGPVQLLPSQDQIKPSRHGASRTPTHEKKRRSHMRSHSHTKTPVRLSTSGPKPHLNRSKSSDLIRTQRQPGLKRNNRSFTKVPVLLPLNKSVLNNAGKAPLNRSTLANSLKGFAPLRKTTLNSSAKDKSLYKTFSNSSMRSSKSLNSLKGLNNSVNNGSGIGLRLSSKRGRAIVKLNEDAESNEYEDLSEDSEVESNDQDQSKETVALNAQEWSDKKGTSLENLHRSMEDVREEHETYKSISEGAEKTGVSGLQALQNSHLQRVQDRDKGKCTSEPPAFMSTNSSSEELMDKNLYGGSLLLSQSTGITRKVGEPLAYNIMEGASDERLDQKMKDERISGISFKARPNNDLRNKEPAEPVAATTTAASVSSYQPDQSIFSNLQKNNSRYLSKIKLQRSNQQINLGQQHNVTGGKDFSNFLNSSHSSNGGHGHNIETRTQQRLWLQRENSLMDVSQNLDHAKLQNLSNMSLNKLMFAHNYNNSTTNVRDQARPQNPQTPGAQLGPLPSESEGPNTGDPGNVTNLLYLIQSGHQQGSVRSRTEYERLNREYLNVRRHLNPVAESLNRLEKYDANLKGIHVQKNTNFSKSASASVHSQVLNANKFEEFASERENRDDKASMLVSRLWQEALLQTSSSSSPLMSRHGDSNEHSSFHLNPQQIQQRSQPMGSSRSSGSVSQRSSLTPTTRAVKLAAQASADGSSSFQR